MRPHSPSAKGSWASIYTSELEQLLFSNMDKFTEGACAACLKEGHSALKCTDKQRFSGNAMGRGSQEPFDSQEYPVSALIESGPKKEPKQGQETDSN